MSLTTEGKPRIESLDVLRGFAILGILIVNAPYFASVWQAAVLPNAVPHLAINDESLWSWLVMYTFFEFKCITLFSMLFGVSIYLVGGERSDKDKGKQLRRRLGWMVLFGLIHGALIWYGDILLIYALTGFPVLLARSLRPMTLLIVGILLTLSMSGLLGLVMMGADHMPPEIAAKQAAAFDVTDAEFAALTARITGDLFGSVATNFEWWAMFFPQSLFIIPRTAGVMMIGLALFKWGFLAARSPVWVYVLFLVLGAVSFAATWVEGLRLYQAGFPQHMMHGEGMLVLSFASPFGTLFYVSLLILILKSGVLGFLLNVLAATGRMAFTNYIAQSLIMTTIFWRLGYFGEVSRPDLWLVVGAVWIAQLIWSPIWLSIFAMGPLEWVWRCLTYKRWVPITKNRAAATAA
jgi:uncharacterized protein